VSDVSRRPVEAPTVCSIATLSCDLHLRTSEKTSNCDEETTNIEKAFRILIKRQTSIYTSIARRERTPFDFCVKDQP
jgi:hypothetical protein